MCDLDWLEPCRVWSETKRIARKAHVCDCCDGAIGPGQEYWTHFSVSGDGDSLWGKVCAPCQVARAEFATSHSYTQPDYFSQALRDCFGDEARQYWSDDDRRWRSLFAGMLLRGRARARTKESLSC